MDLLGQRDIDYKTVPRYGCYVMSLVAIPQLFYGKRFSEQKIIEVIKEAEKTPRWPGQDLNCIDQDPKLPACDMYVWNPGKVADIAFTREHVHYGDEEFHCWQVGDQNGWYSWGDASKRFISFKILEVKRPKGVHFRLADAVGISLYNPIPGMDFPLTGRWISFAVGTPI